MKRLVDLTMEDLAATPVWRYEGGSGADAAVIPARRNSLSQADDEVYLAATGFTLPDSSQYLGFCFPADDSGIDYLQPVIVTRTGHVSFWFDGPIAEEVLAAQWNALGKRADQIFPVSFRCFVQVDGRTVAGTIPNIESSADTSRSVDLESMPSALEAMGGTARAGADSLLPTRGPRPTRVRRLSAIGAGAEHKRTAPRHNVEMMVEFDQGESHGTGVTGDVSRGGMFVRAARIPNVGPSLHLTVSLPDGRKLRLAGRVVRTASAAGLPRSVVPSGFGLRLTDLPAEYEELLSRFLDPSK